ncbi:ion transporter [candidate division KSB1 bacterium]|nr:ion transporter [candidate division KSB1 bacterium]
MYHQHNKPLSPWQHRLHEIIFEADTASGKLFDVVLIASILLSVAIVMLDSVKSVQRLHGQFLYRGEWLFTILFSIEYVLRLVSVRRPIKYAASFFGVIDLLAVVPTYVSLLIPGTHYLLVIRILRILRIFRVFKLAQYMKEANRLTQALRASRRKITVFLFVVLTLVILFGSIMYVIEGEPNGFTSIPRSIYWAVVTLTTVGYGDISPNTNLGQAVAALIMIMGYSIIAVPTGIITVEMSRVANRDITTQACRMCNAEGHDSDAKFCKYCGGKLN